ncbi:MAG: GSCFA domain-containing protein [Bacteroidales bacterium]|nr:GSCFA domain-containing protein [Bacteroidales bacterium]
MKLFTEVSIPEYPFRLGHQSPILMMGSCFTENIGSQLEKYLFPVCINPFGVIYNPLSVKRGLDALLHKKAYVADDLDQYNDLWFSFDHYTGYSSPDREEALQKINLSFTGAKEVLQSAKYLIITWGTAWVFRYNPTGEVVCNCHKIPAAQFTRSRLTTDEIVGIYEALLPSLFEFNQNLKILLTVSPVRHWKDGAHGNQLSKATLLLACEELKKRFPDRLFYFPSYEIVMDELRDYRYYGDDLLHTSGQATEYIWEKFRHSLISDESKQIIGELQPLLNMMDHRPIHPGGDAYMKMVRKQENKRQKLQEKYPFLAWDNQTI